MKRRADLIIICIIFVAGFAHAEQGKSVGQQVSAVKSASITLLSKTSVAEVKAIEAARDSALLKAKSLQFENDKLKKDADRLADELKAVRVALANADLRSQSLEEDSRKIVDDVNGHQAKMSGGKSGHQNLTDSSNGKLMELADNGESIYFKGIGEAKMASADGKTALRFPIVASGRADKVFSASKAERRLHGSFAYYLIDSKLLTF